MLPPGQITQQPKTRKRRDAWLSVLPQPERPHAGSAARGFFLSPGKQKPPQ